ncbi:MAG: hypothetical protein HFE64_10210 [Lachnospiraceae bacterium]|jgi:hypothetical protein|nr:hypothetical protein [Lachnospiraceae bacterium]
MRKSILISLLCISMLCSLPGCQQEPPADAQSGRDTESSALWDREIIPVDLSVKERVVEVLRWEFPKVDPEAYDVTEWAQEFLNEISEVAPYMTDCYAVGKTDGDMRPLLVGCFDYEYKDDATSRKMEKAILEKLKALAEGSHLNPMLSDDGESMFFAVASGGHHSNLFIYQAWVQNGWFADSEESK